MLKKGHWGKRVNPCILLLLLLLLLLSLSLSLSLSPSTVLAKLNVFRCRWLNLANKSHVSPPPSPHRSLSLSLSLYLLVPSSTVPCLLILCACMYVCTPDRRIDQPASPSCLFANPLFTTPSFANCLQRRRLNSCHQNFCFLTGIISCFRHMSTVSMTEMPIHIA